MTRPKPVRLALFVAALAVPAGASGQSLPGYSPEACPSCASWNTDRAPVRVFGNSYWVGPEGLGSMLITSDDGHILIDGALPESVEIIRRNVEVLGFRMEDVRLILSSHAHFDHAGGIAELHRLSGAEVAALPQSAAALEAGRSGAEDPQHGILLPFPPVPFVRRISDSDTLRVGDQLVVAHHTGGHTPGGTTWSWTSCEGERCLGLVYADSQTPVSAGDFLFSRNDTYPSAVEDFRRAHRTLAGLRCDILITPHPGASGFWDRVSAREAGDVDALVDPDACRRYADAASAQLERRLEREGG